MNFILHELRNLKLLGLFAPFRRKCDPERSTAKSKDLRSPSLHTNSIFALTRIVPVVCFFLVACASLHAAPPDTWRTTLQKELPLLGHRNWIVIADSAYPLHVSPGVETIETGASQDEVVRAVLDDLSHATHVGIDVYIDAELPYLTEQSSPGVTTYRNQIHATLGTLTVQSRPHDQLIRTLDESGKTFHVLLLKTTLTVPYSSVFIRLNCRCWRDTSEQELRRRMQQHPSPSQRTGPQ